MFFFQQDGVTTQTTREFMQVVRRPGTPRSLELALATFFVGTSQDTSVHSPTLKIGRILKIRTATLSPVLYQSMYNLYYCCPKD